MLLASHQPALHVVALLLHLTAVIDGNFWRPLPFDEVETLRGRQTIVRDPPSDHAGPEPFDQARHRRLSVVELALRFSVYAARVRIRDLFVEEERRRHIKPHHETAGEKIKELSSALASVHVLEHVDFLAVIKHGN